MNNEKFIVQKVSILTNTPSLNELINERIRFALENLKIE